MIFWIKKRYQHYSLAPKLHVLNQVSLLLEQDMPFQFIRETLNLKHKTLDSLVSACYHQSSTTYSHLSSMFSQKQLLLLHLNLIKLKLQLWQSIIKKLVYPISIFALSFVCLMVFYYYVYPLFLNLYPMRHLAWFQTYLILSHVFIVLILLLTILIKTLKHSYYKQTILLQKLHQLWPHAIIFEYYNNVFIHVYALCLKENYSSLMTIELLRGLQHLPYCQAMAYHIYELCHQGEKLHQAIIKQKISLALNQAIEIGIAANDLAGSINRLSNMNHQLFTYKLERFIQQLNIVVYIGVSVHIIMIIQVIQLPIEIMNQIL